MTSAGCRDTRAEVSLDAIARNVRLFRENLGIGVRLMAVVKADGYGHGAEATARTAIETGADYLGVALADEAIALRDAGIEAPILILGHSTARAIEAAVRQRIAIAVSSRDMWDDVVSVAGRLGKQAIVHLKVDTGMARLGFQPEKVLAFCLKRSHPLVTIEGIFTHFADADNPDPSFTRSQFERFVNTIAQLADHGIHIPIKHCCNSAAAMRFPEMHMDMARIGIAMYGLSPLTGAPLPSYPLLEAMQLKTSISYIKKVTENRPVSYGLTYTTTEESSIATLPVGYADGLSRQLSNNGFALVQGVRVPIVGRVCMDQTMIDVTSLPDVKTGDEVTLFGRSGSDRISIHEVASRMGTISYEAVCLIGKRVPRIYTLKDKLATPPSHTDPSINTSVPNR
ncbi:alanine racemase [Cohnella sp. GbtcB17]|uniref:alanine racemase n=1 Tax=Cohnella sp. GbtcB17 TaxID=2824762 RepID=UPI001C2F5F15|nr:alanine racemase [Cohnella sp. GbtcB17]